MSVRLMAHSVFPLRIIYQPKKIQRARYESEMQGSQNRPQRYIRAEGTSTHNEYPTVEITQQWIGRRIYIRVTLVTTPTTDAPVVCVHPYPIDTPESKTIKDQERNTIYFLVTEEDFRNGQKSFRITRHKLIQYKLRNYGPLRLLDGDEMDILRISDPNNARQLIEVYQLGESRLLFSIAELLDPGLLPVTYAATSVYSDTMTASTTITPTDDGIPHVRYGPTKGDWQGGDEVLMYIPRLAGRRCCSLSIEYDPTQPRDIIEFQFVDNRTIAFTTPRCPILANGNHELNASIIVTQNNEEIARVNFLYQSSSNRCLTCERNGTLNSFDELNTRELSSTMDTYFDEDSRFS